MRVVKGSVASNQSITHTWKDRRPRTMNALPHTASQPKDSSHDLSAATARVLPAKMTATEFLAWPFPDGERWELLDGTPTEMPAPSVNHQMVLHALIVGLASMDPTGDRGQVLPVPTDLKLPTGDVVQPDLLVVPWEGIEAGAKFVEAVPSLVVEILSRDRDADEVTKRRIYRQSNVPEYWLVDPDALTIQILALDSRKRYLTQRTDPDGFGFSPTLAHWIRLAAQPRGYALQIRNDDNTATADA